MPTSGGGHNEVSRRHCSDLHCSYSERFVRERTMGKGIQGTTHQLESLRALDISDALDVVARARLSRMWEGVNKS